MCSEVLSSVVFSTEEQFTHITRSVLYTINCDQAVVRNISENKWGTKAGILVMVGGGHADPLVRRCLIYRTCLASEVRISKDLGVRNLGDLARMGGRQKIKGSLI